MKNWAIVALTAACLSLAGSAGAARPPVYSFARERAAARALGLPTSFKEIRLPKVPPGQDAAPDYRRADAFLKAHDFSDAEYALIEKLGSTSGVTDAEAAELRRAFNARADYFSALRAGASKPYLRVPRTSNDPEAVVSEQFPVLARLREVAKMLRAESQLLLREGHTVESAKAAGLILNAGQQVAQEPSFIALLVGLAMDAIGQAGLRTVLQDAGSSPDVDRVVRDVAARYLSGPDLRHAVAGEIAFAGAYADSARRHHAKAAQRAQAVADAAGEIHWLVRVSRASQAPEALRRQRIQAVLRELSRVRPARWTTAAKEQVPIVASILDRCDEDAARNRVLYAAAGVLEYKARQGRFPARLADAVNPVPLDPFDQKPLAYRLTARGFEIEPLAASAHWSKDTLNPARRRDLVFTYPKPGGRVLQE